MFHWISLALTAQCYPHLFFFPFFPSQQTWSTRWLLASSSLFFSSPSSMQVVEYRKDHLWNWCNQHHNTVLNYLMETLASLIPPLTMVTPFLAVSFLTLISTWPLLFIKMVHHSLSTFAFFSQQQPQLIQSCPYTTDFYTANNAVPFYMNSLLCHFW